MRTFVALGNRFAIRMSLDRSSADRDMVSDKDGYVLSLLKTTFYHIRLGVRWIELIVIL